MRVSARRTISLLAPPILVHAVRRRRRSELRFFEVDGEWADACRASNGYDDEEILRRVVAANRAVVEGRAAFERDSVLFDVPEPPLGVLVGLLRSAAQDGGRLHVIDVGGSLGTMYRRCLRYLEGLVELRWDVVEQPSFVRAGRDGFASGELGFALTIDDVAPSSVRPTYVLASVLQYLEEPYGILEAIALRPGPHAVIERTPVWDGPRDILAIQQVPREVYDASYPAWIFSRERLLGALEDAWRIIGEHASPEGCMVTDRRRPFTFVDLLLEARP